MRASPDFKVSRLQSFRFCVRAWGLKGGRFLSGVGAVLVFQDHVS